MGQSEAHDLSRNPDQTACVASKKDILIWNLSSLCVSHSVFPGQREAAPSGAFKLSIKLETPGPVKALLGWEQAGTRETCVRTMAFSWAQLQGIALIFFPRENCTHSPVPHGADIFLAPD